MVNQYSVENFKIHKKSELLRFEGLTVLAGANNSGKTSLIQSLRVLAKMATSQTPLIYLPLEQMDELGNLKDTLNKGVNRSEMICYQFQLEGSQNKECLVSLKFGSSLTLNEINQVMRQEQAVLKEFTLRFIYDNVAREFCFKLQDREYQVLTTYAMYEIRDGKEFFLEDVGMYKFLIMSHILQINEQELKDELNQWLAILMSLNENKIRYLGPYRMISKTFKGNDNLLMEANGSNSAELLSKSGDVVIFDGETTLRDAFGSWARKILGCEIQAKYEQEEYRLITAEEGIEFGIHQIGFGNTQILPVILQVLLAKKGDLVIIENPEVHLHPRWKAELVELFYYAIEHGVKLIVETQSVEIVTRIRLKVKENPQLESLTNLYFFEKKGFESDITFIEIEKTGRLSVWPKNFLDEVMMEDSVKLI